MGFAKFLKVEAYIVCAVLMLFSSTALSGDLPETISGKDGAEMVFVPGGKFDMGTDDEDIVDVAPWHTVNVGDFYMDKYEVTNELFAKFLNAVRPEEGIGGKRWNWVVLRSDLDFDERTEWWPTEIIYENGNYRAFPGFGHYPVITVSWDAADAYCKWAGKRLPTEAEWEKAARGGLKKKHYPWGDEIPTGGIVFNKSWRDNNDPPPTSSVGNYHSNGYGLFDMAGNVWEWCSDWFHPLYYNRSPKDDPKGPPGGAEKVLRGGSWFNNAMVMRVAFRNWSVPFANDDGVGFRCVADTENEE